MVINRLVNLFRKKNKDQIDYKKFGMGCIKSPEDEHDYIWENRLKTKDVKCDYYREKMIEN